MHTTCTFVPANAKCSIKILNRRIFLQRTSPHLCCYVISTYASMFSVSSCLCTCSRAKQSRIQASILQAVSFFFFLHRKLIFSQCAIQLHLKTSYSSAWAKRLLRILISAYLMERNFVQIWVMQLAGLSLFVSYFFHFSNKHGIMKYLALSSNCGNFLSKYYIVLYQRLQHLTLIKPGQH